MNIFFFQILRLESSTTSYLFQLCPVFVWLRLLEEVVGERFGAGLRSIEDVDDVVAHARGGAVMTTGALRTGVVVSGAAR